MSNLRTSGQVATELGVLHHRVLYAIKTRRLQPTAQAGHIRLFSPSDIRVIADVLATIEEAGNGRPGQSVPGGYAEEVCVAEK